MNKTSYLQYQVLSFDVHGKFGYCRSVVGEADLHSYESKKAGTSRGQSIVYLATLVIILNRHIVKSYSKFQQEVPNPATPCPTFLCSQPSTVKNKPRLGHLRNPITSQQDHHSETASLEG